jgi:hypothetical protein
MTKARDLASGIPVPSTVSTTELGYVDGVTSAIQTQMDSKLATATASSTYQTKAATGLVLLNTTSFSAVASQILTADIFTSTYTNYRIVFNITSQTNTGILFLKLRAASTTSSTGYYYSYGNNASNASSIGGFAGSNTSGFFLGFGGSTRQNQGSIDLFRPKVAAFTLYSGVTSQMETGVSYTNFQAGGQDSATSYDTCVIEGANGNITGSISVYGYNI